MTQKSPIVLVIDSSSSGGIETHLLLLAQSLRTHHQNVKVIQLEDYGHHPMVASLRRQGIEVIALNGSWRRLYNTLKALDCKLIHSHGYKANFYCRIIACLAGIPCVTTFHNGDLGSGKLRLYTWLDEHSAFLSANIAVSQEILQRIPATAELVPNFVPMQPLIESKQKRHIAFVGRLEPVKGPETFVELANLFPQHQFHVYGDGSLLHSLKQKARGNVNFHGFVAEMTSQWHSIDVLLMPSKTEGLPLAALEAMSRGIPVIATAVGELPDIIQHGVNGFIVDHTLGQIEQVVASWIDLPLQRKDFMRNQARNTVKERFADSAIIPRILAIYRQAIVGRNREQTACQ